MPARTGRRWREVIVTAVLERDGGWCHLCGRPGADTADHLTPWSQGGSDDMDNLAAAHVPCNRTRGNRPVHVARAELRAKVEAALPAGGWEW